MPMMGSECGGYARQGGRPDAAVTLVVERVFAALLTGSPPPEAADRSAERAARAVRGAPARVPAYAARPSWAVEHEEDPRRALVPSGR
ncbi:hypothetical protein [Longimicrobium terrae]|uniref:Uncharacterized protein n=1 Tax=Longimicrobium terrae TaxID=1639882 RepID=A0A841H4P5_9BACT|nr:hypothetical protein [Longimicrobium terrae]MBB4638862.1 hypothetical protein [Longimicrobium terrae]MBB6073101.1 hypothetical protein [Longimicrobium terrae]NNC30208.1 hypothetical protein [Longimicrobium terrae]